MFEVDCCDVVFSDKERALAAFNKKFHRNFSTIEKAVKEQGDFEMQFEPANQDTVANIIGTDGDPDDFDVEGIWKCLAPFIKEGSWIEFKDYDNDYHFRVYFQHSEYCLQTPIVTTTWEDM